MRITDIIAKYAEPKTTIVDLTASSSKLSPYFRLPGPSALPVSERAVPGTPAIIVSELVLGNARDARLLGRLTDAAAEASSASFMLFADRADAFIEQGLVNEATEIDLEVTSTHETDHAFFRFAVVLTRSANDSALRARNEYRVSRLLIKLRERRITELEAAVARLEREVENAKNLKAALGRANKDRDAARSESVAQKKRAEAIEKHLDLTHRKMIAARRSVSFRIGRATKLAWKDSKKKPLELPTRWLQAFREKSEVPPNLPPLRVPAQVGRHAPEDAELAAIARENLLLDLPPLSKPAPGIALVSGSRLDLELQASTRVRQLTPNTWRFLLEVERPAFVLVTADGIAAGTAWGNIGSPDGRATADALHALCEGCTDHQVPIVYWDTLGVDRHRLGLPPGVRFDAIFSVSPRARGLRIDNANPGVEHLPAAVAPSFNPPTGLTPAPPRGALFAGPYDGRLSREARSRLEAALDGAAASTLALEIRDPNHDYVGADALALQFPQRFISRKRLKGAARDEAARLRELGLLIAHPPIDEPDFVPWDLLRALACGAHVATTSDPVDPVLAAATTRCQAGATIFDELAARDRLDETWQEAFEHILAHYSLRGRLDVISDRLGASRVTPPTPKLALLGQVTSSDELASLRSFLAIQTTPPTALNLIASEELDVASGLASAIGPSRLSVSLAGSSPGEGSGGFASGDATHLLCWHARVPMERSAVTDLLSLARMSDDALVSVSRDGRGPDQPTFHYGEPDDSSILAVRRDAVSGGIAAAAANPMLTVRQMMAQGTKLFTKRRSV